MSSESCKCVPDKTRMSREFDPRKNVQSTKLRWRPQILVKLSLREFRVVFTFDNIFIALGIKNVVKSES